LQYRLRRPGRHRSIAAAAILIHRKSGMLGSATRLASREQGRDASGSIRIVRNFRSRLVDHSPCKGGAPFIEDLPKFRLMR
jgi:hypothetical protein